MVKRYDSDKEFDHYRKKSSRKLGNDMRSHHPETTLLPDLTMRPMANEVVLPLQDVRPRHSHQIHTPRHRQTLGALPPATCRPDAADAARHDAGTD